MTGLPNDISTLPPIDQPAATANNHVGPIASTEPLSDPASHPKIPSGFAEMDASSGTSAKPPTPEEHLRDAVK